MVPKSIYPISYINSGEPRWGSASSAQFRQLPQCFFPISFIHITTLNPITPLTHYAIPNPKLTHDILRHEAQLRHKPKTIFILLSSHYDFGSSFCLQLRQPKTPKPNSFKLRHSTQLWHTPIAPTQNPKILISIPHILFYLSFHSHDYLIITSPRIST